MLQKNENGIRVIAPEDTGSSKTAQCVVLDTFTKITGDKKTTYGLLFNVDSHEFLMAIAEPAQPQVVGEDGVSTTKWGIIMVETNIKSAVDRFYAARLGIIEPVTNGVVTVII